MTEQNTAAAGGQTAPVWGSCERIGAGLASVVAALTPPEDVLAHFRAARVELLKGLRAAIDARIERLEQRHRAGTSVTIE